MQNGQVARYAYILPKAPISERYPLESSRTSDRRQFGFVFRYGNFLSVTATDPQCVIQHFLPDLHDSLCPIFLLWARGAGDVRLRWYPAPIKTNVSWFKALARTARLRVISRWLAAWLVARSRTPASTPGTLS
jgi:hypothetical protein